MLLFRPRAVACAPASPASHVYTPGSAAKAAVCSLAAAGAKVWICFASSRATSCERGFQSLTVPRM